MKDHIFEVKTNESMINYRDVSRLTKKLLAAIATLMVLLAHGTATFAHEFWLEPETYRPSPGQSIPLRHFIGQKFKGTSYPFVPEWFKSFTVTQDGKTSDIAGTLGDDPAALVSFDQRGLKILTFHGTPDKLVFKSWKKFRDYLNFEGLNSVVEQHGQALATRQVFREDYVRCAKTLMQVGPDATEQDRAIGLPLELLAEQNPYGLSTGDTLSVRLLLKGQPLAGTLVRILTRTDPENQKPVRTDENGRARIPLPHSGAYLLNAVVMTNKKLPGKDEAWKSLWASLSFAVK